MLSVQQAVRTLRREILDALAEDAPLPNGASLVADRVSMSFGVQVAAAGAVASETGGFVLAADPSDSLHRVTVEFRVEPAGTLSRAPAERAAPAASAKPGAREPEHPAFSALAEVFGPPGFDSSARATVFREALEELDETQGQQALLSLGVQPVGANDPAVSRARHLLLRLAGSGPAGPERGPSLLRQLAGGHPAKELVRLAADRWRTQSEWADGFVDITPAR